MEPSSIARERERLLSLISNVPGVVWEAWGEPDAASQHINFVSGHVEQMLGYTCEEWLSTPNFWLSVVHPDDRDAVARLAHEHFLGGRTTVMRFRWMTKDGRALWVEAHSTVIHDGHGKPIGMRGVTFDITAQKRAEDSLRFLAEASEFLASSLDYETTLQKTARLAVPRLADWCVVALNESGDESRRAAVVHADPQKNLAAQKLLAIPPRGAMPREVTELYARKQPFVLELTDELIAQMTYDADHAALVRELGAASMLVVPIEARERMLGAISFVSATPGRYTEPDRDLAMLLARRVAVAIDNAQLYRTALDASAAKDEFLATVSHELRTPLTATLGWTRLLLVGQLDPETTRIALHAIESSAHAQARLIDDILDVSSIVLGKFRMEHTPVDLRRVVDEAAAAVRPALGAKEIVMNVDTSRWHGAVQGDANRLQQIVWNLLSNAVKFSRRAGHIDVALEREASVARIIVKDDGAGIDREFLPHVFERFRQAEGGPTRSFGGLGLGLAIVRHLTELHGGTVTASSEGRDKGATFVVELPAAVDTARVAEPAPAVLSDLSGKQILIVDDEETTLQFVSAVLRNCGAGVTTAKSADEALLALNRQHHDLVVTDISMPGTDGEAMLEQARAQGTRIPAIALTARNSTPRGDFARVLRKPVDPVDLARQVAQVLATEG